MVELKEKWDAIVVGAGPGGIECAGKIAELGLSVLCLEKDQEIGTPKRCGEGLGGGWIKRLNLKVSKEWAVKEMFGAALFSPSGKKVEIRMDKLGGYVIERKMFEKHLAREASLKGAKFIAKARMTDVIKKDNKVIGIKANVMGEAKEFFAPIVVAADGVESLTARRAGLMTTPALIDIDSGFQYEMAGIDFEDDDLISLFFGTKIARRGYVWIFPKGKHEANVGIGILGDGIKNAKQYLDEFIEAHEGLKKGSILEVNGSSIPVGGFLERQTMNGLIVLGDAAHHVNPIHGGGMGLAMESGRLAGEWVAKAHKANDFSDNFLHQYTTNWYELRGNELMKILKRRKMFESMSDKDFETVAGSFTGEDVLKLAHGEMVESAALVTKKLVLHPGLAKIFLKFLK